jgi:hypothetical protein
MVAEARSQRQRLNQAATDWIVLRNRLSSLGSRNKRMVGEGLQELSRRLDFRCVDGLAERVIFREFYPRGLTALDETRTLAEVCAVVLIKVFKSNAEPLQRPARLSCLGRISIDGSTSAWTTALLRGCAPAVPAVGTVAPTPADNRANAPNIALSVVIVLRKRKSPADPAPR